MPEQIVENLLWLSAKEIADLLSVSERSVRDWTKDVRADEKREQQERAFDLWLDCRNQAQIAAAVGVTQQAVQEWVEGSGRSADFFQAPESRQHFDIWNFQSAPLHKVAELARDVPIDLDHDPAKLLRTKPAANYRRSRPDTRGG